MPLDRSGDAPEPVLGRRFFDDLALLAEAPDPASPAADRAFRAFSAFCERIEVATQSEMNPVSRSWFDGCIRSEGGRSKEIRRWCGPRRGVKLLFAVRWGGSDVSVALTKWMAPDDESDRFSDFLGSPQTMARERLRRLSMRLEERFEVPLDLVFSRNYEQRRLLERGIEWQEWQKDPSRQATVQAVLWSVIDEDYVLTLVRERAEDPVRQLEELGRILPGTSGRRCLEFASQGRGANLTEEVAAAAREVREHWIRHEQQGLDALLLMAAEGLSELLREFRDKEKKRADVLGNTEPVPALDGSAVKIAEAIHRRTIGDHPRLSDYRPERAKVGLEVLSPSGSDRAVLGWEGTDRRLPRLEIDRRTDALTIDLVLDRQEKEGGEATPSAYRRALAFRADGADGTDLVALVANDPHLSFLAGKSAGSAEIVVRNAEDLRRLFIWRKGEPRLRWTFPVLDSSTEKLRGPVTLISSLLGQALSDDPPALVVPPRSEETFDAFISFAGASGGAVAEQLRGQLQEAKGVGKVWHMSDHQKAGTSIPENNRRGVERSKSIVMLLHSTYWESEYCREEFRIASEQRLPIIPLLIVDTGISDEAALRAAKADAEAAEKSFRSKVVKASLKDLYSHVVPPVRTPLNADGIDPAVVGSVVESVRAV